MTNSSSSTAQLLPIVRPRRFEMWSSGVPFSGTPIVSIYPLGIVYVQRLFPWMVRQEWHTAKHRWFFPLILSSGLTLPEVRRQHWCPYSKDRRRIVNRLFLLPECQETIQILWRQNNIRTVPWPYQIDHREIDNLSWLWRSRLRSSPWGTWPHPSRHRERSLPHWRHCLPPMYPNNESYPWRCNYR